jgi:hypothetical protein
MVIVFHVLTRILFPAIGMFPVIMIFSWIIFFDSSIHKKILDLLKKILNRDNRLKEVFTPYIHKYNRKLIPLFVSVFFLWQVLIPLRSFSYPGELFWTEQGYRFSWRVMLIEKAGYTTFKIVDNATGNSELVDNSLYLTKFQEKQMSFQPDMIIEYAHYLGDIYKKKGFKDVSVYAESYVTLNGRPSQRFIDPEVDLYNEKINFKNKNWILPFKDEIKSFL